MTLWIHEILHFSLYAVAYGTISLFYKPFKDMRHFIVGFLSAVLIDLDHVIDYFIFNRFSSFNLFEFLSCEFYDTAGKAYVIFHGWEYLAVLLVTGILLRKSKWQAVLFAVCLGMFVHLSFDTIVNGLPDYFYFLTSRAINGFRL